MTARLHVPRLPESTQLLAGFSAVVTGAGSAGALAGVGAAVAIRLAQAGATIVLVDREADRARHTAEAIGRSAGREPLAVTGDLTAPETIARVVEAVESLGLGLDVLINSAGIAPDERELGQRPVGRGQSDPDPIDELWSSVLRVNVMAALTLTDAVLPIMRSGGGGSIVNISSVAAIRAGGGAAYSASKAALESLTRSVAHREGVHGIRVNAISPGHLLSPMGLIGANGMGAEGEADMLRRTRAAASVLRKDGTAWDVADAALFLASANSGFITGSTLVVDGGTSQMLPLAMWERIAGEVAEASGSAVGTAHTAIGEDQA